VDADCRGGGGHDEITATGIRDVHGVLYRLPTSAGGGGIFDGPKAPQGSEWDDADHPHPGTVSNARPWKFRLRTRPFPAVAYPVTSRPADASRGAVGGLGFSLVRKQQGGYERKSTASPFCGPFFAVFWVSFFAWLCLFDNSCGCSRMMGG
jgi:hypothetical protein